MRKFGALIALTLVTTVSLPAMADETSPPEFDEKGDRSLDGYEGSDRPDELEVQDRFNAIMGEVDECVWAEKERTKASHLKGDADVAVLLDPKSDSPLGVNAHFPGEKKHKPLQKCLRKASAHAHFPTYDGPPVVVHFEFELDPA